MAEAVMASGRRPPPAVASVHTCSTLCRSPRNHALTTARSHCSQRGLLPRKSIVLRDAGPLSQVERMLAPGANRGQLPLWVDSHIGYAERRSTPPKNTQTPKHHALVGQGSKFVVSEAQLFTKE